MMKILAATRSLAALAAFALAAPLAAQGIETIDPNSAAIDGDLAQP